MDQNRTTYRNILTRSLAVMALLGIYCFSLIGASALLLGASSTPALARGGGGGGGGRGGGGRGGGFRGGGFRGAGFGAGIGLGLGLYGPYGYGGYYPYGYSGYYDDGGICYLVRRRVMTPSGLRIRRVRVCE